MLYNNFIKNSKKNKVEKTQCVVAYSATISVLSKQNYSSINLTPVS